METDWMIGGLWAITLVLMGWNWLPALLAALGKTSYHNGGSEETTGLEVSEAEPDYAYWLEQFQELGYRPVGHGWFRIVYAGDRWVSRSRVRVFYSSQDRFFAFVQTGDSPFDFWLIVTIATCWNNGGLLCTTNVRHADSEQLSLESLDYVRVGQPTHRVSELVEQHLRVRSELEDSSRRPDPSRSLDTLLDAAKEYAGPDLCRFYRRAGRSFLNVNGLFHLCVTIPGAVVLGPTHWGVPLSNLVLHAVLRFGQWAQNQQLAQMIRQQLLGLRAEQVTAGQASVPTED